MPAAELFLRSAYRAFNARDNRSRSNVEQYARDSDVGTRHWNVDEKALAEAHGRGRAAELSSSSGPKGARPGEWRRLRLKQRQLASAYARAAAVRATSPTASTKTTRRPCAGARSRGGARLGSSGAERPARRRGSATGENALAVAAANARGSSLPSRRRSSSRSDRSIRRPRRTSSLRRRRSLASRRCRWRHASSAICATTSSLKKGIRRSNRNMGTCYPSSTARLRPPHARRSCERQSRPADREKPRKASPWDTPWGCDVCPQRFVCHTFGVRGR